MIIAIEDSILLSIASELPTDFGAFCRGLRKNKIHPRDSDSMAWANIFKILLQLQTRELCITRRADDSNDIVWLKLTQRGAFRVKEALARIELQRDLDRPLFAEIAKQEAAA